MDEFDRSNHLKGERFRFPNSSGVQLQGYLYPLPKGRQSNRVMILGHGFSAHAGMMAPLIPLFHELGYHVFLFDFNTHGKSHGRKTSIGYHEGDDVASAMLEMGQKYGKDVKLSYLGHSMGGAAFLFMPKKIHGRSDALKWIADHLDKVALDSTYDVISPSTETRLQDLTKKFSEGVQNWLMDRVKEFEQTSQQTMDLPAPLNALHPVEEFVKEGKFKDQDILLLHGTEDQRASYAAAERIQEVLAEQGYHVTLIPLAGAGHYKDDWQPDPEHPKKKPLKNVVRDDGHLEILRNFFTVTNESIPSPAVASHSGA